MRTTPTLNDDNDETNGTRSQSRKVEAEANRGDEMTIATQSGIPKGDNQAYRTFWLGISHPNLWLSTRIQLPSRERTTERKPSSALLLLLA